MIRTENLTKQFGKLVAVNGLSLNIPAGELFAFLGPNGAGKTTTIKLLTGLLKPTAGRAIIGGHDIQQEPMAARALISYVPDLPFLYEKLEAGEFLRFVGQLYGMEPGRLARRSGELLEQFGLAGTRGQLIENLSHGTRQRVVIAAALLHDPQVLIIDEPMVGLDPRSARLVKDVFRAHCRAGGTVFLSTHSLDVTEELADRIGILSRGKLIALGTMAELRAQAGREGALEEVFLELTREGQGEGGG